MKVATTRTLILVAASAALASTLTMGTVQAAPVTSLTSAQFAATPSRVYLGRVADGNDHNFVRKLPQGTYVIEYDASNSAAMNTYLDVTHPHLVPLQDGRYLGQVGVANPQPADTPTFRLTAGRHKITSQSPEILGGYVDVYLVRQ